jgi:hypothetical protein
MPGDDEEAGRPADSVDLGAQPVLLLGRSGLEVAEFEDGKSGHSVDHLSPYGAHFFRVVASAGSPEAL